MAMEGDNVFEGLGVFGGTRSDRNRARSCEEVAKGPIRLLSIFRQVRAKNKTSINLVSV